ncbi:putative membrane protein [Chlamydia psittaci 08-2626_L3]|nr:putative membrane protein [Chlamydia psittaci 06-1683]EPP28370.1 putative membrane protein [Chlamydia psittaci 08-2626_L3]EPP31242.1 putative membrane protein [Chlamydia psittaci C1/97]
MGFLYIIVLTLTLIDSIFIICVAVYNLLHLHATIMQYSREE